MVTVACGDAFTVAIGAGEGGQDEGGQGKHVVGYAQYLPFGVILAVQGLAACLGCALLFWILGRGGRLFLGQRSPRSTGKEG